MFKSARAPVVNMFTCSHQDMSCLVNVPMCKSHWWRLDMLIHFVKLHRSIFRVHVNLGKIRLFQGST